MRNSELYDFSNKEGMKEGSIVMMKMPKPKPVVRCTKLAPMLNRKSSMTILSILQ